MNRDLLTKLQKFSLGERFAFAEQESQDKKVLHQTLIRLQKEMRFQFLQELRSGAAVSLNALRSMQEVLIALRQTNVSGRLAMERVLLEL